MRKIVVVTVLLVFAASAVFAGGDKNRGSKGQGEVVQRQIRNTDNGTPAFDCKD
jgi:hypothetical protein